MAIVDSILLQRWYWNVEKPSGGDVNGGNNQYDYRPSTDNQRRKFQLCVVHYKQLQINGNPVFVFSLDRIERFIHTVRKRERESIGILMIFNVTDKIIKIILATRFRYSFRSNWGNRTQDALQWYITLYVDLSLFPFAYWKANTKCK